MTWEYTQGTELRDPSGKELGDYYGRLVSWYVNGGFTDENGKRHESGYHYRLPVWEVLNEPELEHATTPEQYTERYDAIVEGIHRVSPETKFMGLALAYPRIIRITLSTSSMPANHKPGIPIDYISYHFYAIPTETSPWPTGSTPTSTRLTDFSPRSATSRTFASAWRQRPKPTRTSWGLSPQMI